jgi:hypothetical protein
MGRMNFAINAEVSDPMAETFSFSEQKTMYGGKHIAIGDTIFIFASENEGGAGLIATGVITTVKAMAKKPGVARQTPRVSITVRRTALAKRHLGRSELKLFPNGTTPAPRPNSISNSIARQQTRSSVFRRKRRHSCTGTFETTAFDLNASQPTNGLPLVLRARKAERGEMIY